MKRWLGSGAVVVSVLLMFVAVLPGVTCQAQNADGQTWKFVVFGDTPDPDIATITGHCPILGNLSARIAGESPDLVIYVGDLINGLGTTNASPVHGDFDTQFSNWKSAVQPIYDFQNSSGVPIYVARGNHEVFLITEANTTLVDSYMRNIGSLMPQNGPSTEAGLTYWVQHKGAEFISLDQYRAPNVVDMGTVNQSWLDQRLASDSSEFTFVWGHTPAYASVGTAPSLYLNTTERDAFWSSLDNNNVTAYFCGHVHNYARGNANGTWEVLVGNGGATAQPITPSFLPTSINDTYPNLSTGNWTADDGYLLVTVDEAAGTAHAQLKMHGVANDTWYDGDSFTMQAGNYHAATAAPTDYSLPIAISLLVLLSVGIAVAVIYRRRRG